jgi:phosphoglucosamine mutase
VPWIPGKSWTEHARLVAAKAQVESMLGERGRVLIRASGTEPKLRLMVEAEDDSLVEQGIAILTGVDLS